MRNFGTRSAINRHPLTVTPYALVKEAIALMSKTDSRSVVVLAGGDSNSPPIGVFTEGDVVRLAAERVDLESVSVASVMNKQFVTITETEAEDIFAVVNQIKQHQIPHLTVVSEMGNFVGIITPETIGDMIGLVDISGKLVADKTSELKLLNQQLEKEISQRKLIEDQLRSSEMKMRATLEAMSDIILVVNTQDNQLGNLEVLPTSSIYLNERSIDLLSQTVEAFFQDKTAKIWLAKVRQALEKKQTLNFDYSLFWMGEEVWFTVSISPASDTSVVWVARDITQRKRAEMALCESEERFCAIFEQAAVGIKQIAISGELIRVNQRLCEILGYTESELLATTVNHVIYQDDVEADLECKRQILAFETATSSIERRFVCKDGQLKWVKSSLSLVRNEKGNPEYFISVIEDISERKQLEEALKESQHWLQTIVSANPNILYVYDLIEKRNVYCNREISEILGYTQEEVFSMEKGFLATVIHRDDLAAFTEHQLRLDTAKDGEIFELEYRMCHKNGEWHWRKSRYTLFSRDSNGNPKQILGTASDISEVKRNEAVRKKAEARERNKSEQLEIALTQLQRTQTQLVLSEKMVSLGSLVAGVAHEINNPTSFIYSNIDPAGDYAEQLLSLINLYQRHYPQPIEEISKELKSIDLNFIAKDFPKLLNSMKIGAQRITEIVLSLRNFSRLDESNSKLADIHEGIDNTLLILQYRLKKHLNIPEIKIIKDYGKLPKIKCYPGQLNQVFMNILCNAIDALEESFIREFGEIRIRTQIVESKIIICIGDNGPGMKTEIQSRIFDPFFTTKPPGKGTGLGLSISYQIVVNRHGGEIKCHSVLGQGTEFVIELPIV